VLLFASKGITASVANVTHRFYSAILKHNICVKTQVNKYKIFIAQRMFVYRFEEPLIHYISRKYPLRRCDRYSKATNISDYLTPPFECVLSNIL